MTAAEVERALEGIVEIAAFIETLWRKHRALKIAVSRRQAQWLIATKGLPAMQKPTGQWVASPGAVEAWWLSVQLHATVIARNVRVV
jgi:hypothetical protein